MAGGSNGGDSVDEISLGFTLDMGFPPWKRHSGRLASRCGALPLQITCQGLRSRQGKTRPFIRSFVEYSLIARFHLI